MNPVPLFLIILTLPLLIGGCNQSSSVLKYEIHGDSVTITGCDEDVSGELVIPVTIKGKPVTSIEGEAFFRCQSLTSITIPDGVTSIGFRAFMFCSSLTSITIGEGVTSIEHAAFIDCKSLTAVTFLGDSPTVGKGVFAGAPPTIYRKTEAKGWRDTFVGRPVKLISEKP